MKYDINDREKAEFRVEKQAKNSILTHKCISQTGHGYVQFATDGGGSTIGFCRHCGKAWPIEYIIENSWRKGAV